MQPAKLNRTIRFKFGKALRKGTKVLIAQTNENTCFVRIPSEPTLEYLVSKDALTMDNVQFWHVIVTENCIRIAPYKTYKVKRVKNSVASFTERQFAVAQANTEKLK